MELIRFSVAQILAFPDENNDEDESEDGLGNECKKLMKRNMNGDSEYRTGRRRLQSTVC